MTIRRLGMTASALLLVLVPVVLAIPGCGKRDDGEKSNLVRKDENQTQRATDGHDRQVRASAAGVGECKRVGRTVVVSFPTRRFPGTIRHMRDAIRRGKARVLHIARNLAKRHREQSLKGIPTKRGHDRDEYPPAFSREGGTGADVRYVRSSDNRGAGSSMGSQLRPYCNGQAFRFRFVPGAG